MDSRFQISDPLKDVFGDSLNFYVIDGDETVAARVSLIALSVLARGEHPQVAFARNKERIRKVAYAVRRANPKVGLLTLNATHFL
ncbi:hypothetical protein [Paraburkholderia sp. GAS334]|jgi:hypothetical protein|uniref:hypothetical protein n=1 Tax=unclassified Paraburkholderia TaxID=2615204 RepID=UPI003D1B833E